MHQSAASSKTNGTKFRVLSDRYIHKNVNQNKISESRQPQGPERFKVNIVRENDYENVVLITQLPQYKNCWSESSPTTQIKNTQ